MTGKTGHRQTRAAKQHPIGAPLPNEAFCILGFVKTDKLDKLMAKRLIVTRTVSKRPEADGKNTTRGQQRRCQVKFCHPNESRPSAWNLCALKIGQFLCSTFSANNVLEWLLLTKSCLFRDTCHSWKILLSFLVGQLMKIPQL